MRLDRATHTRIFDDVVTTLDPTGSTVELGIGHDDDWDWYSATWLGSPVTGPDGTWTQTAQTVGYFAGPDGNASLAVVLPIGRHFTKTRVTLGQDIIVGDSSSIYVP